MVARADPQTRLGVANTAERVSSGRKRGRRGLLHVRRPKLSSRRGLSLKPTSRNGKGEGPHEETYCPPPVGITCLPPVGMALPPKKGPRPARKPPQNRVWAAFTRRRLSPRGEPMTCGFRNYRKCRGWLTTGLSLNVGLWPACAGRRNLLRTRGFPLHNRGFAVVYETLMESALTHSGATGYAAPPWCVVCRVKLPSGDRWEPNKCAACIAAERPPGRSASSAAAGRRTGSAAARRSWSLFPSCIGRIVGPYRVGPAERRQDMGGSPRRTPGVPDVGTGSRRTTQPRTPTARRTTPPSDPRLQPLRRIRLEHRSARPPHRPRHQMQPQKAEIRMSKTSKPSDRWSQVFSSAHDRPDTFCIGCGYYVVANGVPVQRVRCHRLHSMMFSRFNAIHGP